MVPACLAQAGHSRSHSSSLGLHAWRSCHTQHHTLSSILGKPKTPLKGEEADEGKYLRLDFSVCWEDSEQWALHGQTSSPQTSGLKQETCSALAFHCCHLEDPVSDCTMGLVVFLVGIYQK